ncbi:MAG: tripartite tricarboxylate transporter permease [Armatimonadota bacterium]|nr:tripartite tricarboxylate transporter permease [Armatimonadota bacterium]MDR7514791.1 tripartite tricarboxylate transporter permease [Armatimonadota bacterium]MDR7578750.1 tripartite tricarboxylate transporter permease [Armatimonadota bacterium]MDR7581356.1 tripartite tricarboxylate transporter permease [Armatimonadota bacterium]
MAEAALRALEVFASPDRLVLLLAGILAGIVVGLLPGMGGIVAVSLILPYVFRMDAVAAVAVLTGALAVVHTSDTITSVLIGAPGSAASATSVIEGHPLARQGQAARALSAAFLSSMIGGLLGALGLTLSIPVARPLVLSMGAPELFMLTALGVSYAGSLLGKEVRKGLLSGLLGMLFGLVGPSPAAAQVRFDFGSLYLMDGLPLAVVALGIFGVAEVVNLLAEGGSIAQTPGLGRGWLEGVRDVLRHRWLVVRGALIGIWAGILPALGATAGTWMAYGHVVATSRDRENFGKGDIRGIIAPESANNAVAAGDLIPTLLFMVPGSASAAILVGALLRYGILPGPRILTEHLDLVYVVIWSYALANVIGAGICFAASPALARVTQIPFAKLAGPVLVAMMLGAYQASQELGDLVTLLLLGTLGWGMASAAWPRAPFLIGFVLVGPMERYFVITKNLYGWTWLARPGVWIIGAALLAPFVWGLVRWSRGRGSRPASPPSGSAPARSALDAGVSAAVLGGFALAALLAVGLVPGARELPLFVALAGCGLGAVQLVEALRGRTGSAEGQPDPNRLRGGAIILAGLCGFVGVTAALGFLPGVAALTLWVTWKLARMHPGWAVAYTVAAAAGVHALAGLLALHLPGARLSL